MSESLPVVEGPPTRSQDDSEITDLEMVASTYFPDLLVIGGRFFRTLPVTVPRRAIVRGGVELATPRHLEK
jgi:hypothetical protein